MNHRLQTFRAAIDRALGADDPAAELKAVGWALQSIGRDLAGRPPAEQRVLLMAAREHSAERRGPRRRL